MRLRKVDVMAWCMMKREENGVGVCVCVLRVCSECVESVLCVCSECVECVLLTRHCIVRFCNYLAVICVSCSLFR